MVIPGWPLTRRALLRHLDVAAIEDAIQRAEATTSGEIRVSTAGFFRGGTQALAERAFRKLGMDRTRHRNAVLILLAPTRRQVTILGDTGITARVPPAFWTDLTMAVVGRFARGEFTAGLVEAIDELGRTLARHFPPEADAANVNEIPDTVGRV